MGFLQPLTRFRPCVAQNCFLPFNTIYPLFMGPDRFDRYIAKMTTTIKLICFQAQGLPRV